MNRLRPAGAVAVGVVALVLGTAGCSSPSTSSATTPSGSQTVPSASQTDPQAFYGVTVSGSLGSTPAFLIGDETQATPSLQVHDVAVGTGPAATSSDHVTVQYAARSAKTKQPFDSSWARGKPFSYDPARLSFKAFTEGVAGMRVGGRRIVIVPGPLAFGASPPPSMHLGPNETLVFVIDLLSIDSAGASAGARSATTASPGG